MSDTGKKTPDSPFTDASTNSAGSDGMPSDAELDALQAAIDGEKAGMKARAEKTAAEKEAMTGEDGEPLTPLQMAVKRSRREREEPR